MAETFENLEDVLPDWTEDGTEESLAQAVNLYEKQEEGKKRLFVEDNLENILEKLQSRETQNGSWKYFKVRTQLFASHLTNPTSKTNESRVKFISNVQLFSVSKYLFTQIDATKETSRRHLLKWTQRN